MLGAFTVKLLLWKTTCHLTVLCDWKFWAISSVEWPRKWAVARTRTSHGRQMWAPAWGTPSVCPPGARLLTLCIPGHNACLHTLPMKTEVSMECPSMMAGESSFTEPVLILRAPWRRQGVCKFYGTELIGIYEAKFLEFRLSIFPPSWLHFNDRNGKNNLDLEFLNDVPCQWGVLVETQPFWPFEPGTISSWGSGFPRRVFKESGLSFGAITYIFHSGGKRTIMFTCTKLIFRLSCPKV